MTRANLKAYKAILVTVGSSLCYSAPVLAEDSSSTENADKVQEIVVTAQFRGQNLQRTPLAITATTAEMLEARSQTGVVEVAAHAPSVTMQSGGGVTGAQSTQINIRGIGQSDANVANEPGVGIYVDDVYHGLMYASTPELLDLERVEILRGPQGTLSGRNSVGGAIRLISKRPTDDTSGYVEGTYGSFNRMDLRAGINFPLVADRVFARFNGLAKQRDGYVTRYDYQCVNGKPPAPINAGSQIASGGDCKIGTEGGQSVVALRGAVRAILSDNIENTLTVDFTNDKSEPSGTVLIHQGTWHGPGFNMTANPPVLNTPENFVLPAGSYANYSNYTALIGTSAQYTLPAVSNVKNWTVSNVVDVKLGDAISLNSITAWLGIDSRANVDLDGSPINRLLQSWGVRHRQFTQELRLNGSAGSLADWTLGGFYYFAHTLQSGRAGLDGAADNSSAPPLQTYTTMDFVFNDPATVKSKAAFAHVELHPLEKLTLTGGLRYTSDEKTYVFHRALAPGVPASLLSSSVLPLDGKSGRFQGNRWDWRVSANYQVASSVNLYGQIATGFKGGGVNPRPYYEIQIQPFAPEVVRAYEVGLKSDLFDRKLRFNVAGYVNKYSNLQLTLYSCPQFVPAGSAPNCAMPANVGDATIKGVEVEAELHPSAGLSIDGSISYTDFRYDNVSAVTRITPTMVPPYTPKWKAAAGIQYDVNIGDRATITPRLDWTYQSEVWSDPLNSVLNRIPGRSLVNARLTYKSADDAWQLAVAITNLFDKYYYVNLYDRDLPNNKSYQVLTGQPGRPREWSVSIKRKF